MTTSQPAARHAGRRPPRVAVGGMAFWTQVAEGLLDRAGIQHDRLCLPGAAAGLAWAAGWPRRRVDLVYNVWGLGKTVGVAARLARLPMAWHWCGSDVQVFTHYTGWQRWVHRFNVYRRSNVHLADSPELAAELAELDIDAKVVRLLPKTIEGEVLSLPDRPAVMAYWRDDRMAFYGGEIVFELARRRPGVEFRIVQARGGGQTDVPPNVKFLGPQDRDGIEAVYASVCALIRLPEHDSLSAMVLEALARGRYAIYNKPMPGVDHAADVDSALRCLDEILSRSQPNTLGAAHVAREFSLDAESHRLRAALFP